MRQPKQYKHLQKSKFQDKGRKETDKGQKNIPENLTGDRTAVEIRAKRGETGKGRGSGKKKKKKRRGDIEKQEKEKKINAKKLMQCNTTKN